MAKRPVTYENEYRGYPINTVKEKGLGCDERFLEKYWNHVDDMTDRHSKVMQVRFDLRYPSDGSVEFDPRHISRLGWYLTRHFDRSNTSHHSVDLRFRWSCEQKEGATRPHYHCIVLVNGNAHKSEYAIFKQVERYWRIVC